MRIRPLLLFIFLLAFVGCKESKNEILSLNGEWQFSEAKDTLWMPAIVPGTVQTDLLALGEIPDPFKGNNEDSIQWVSAKNWIYKKQFTVPKRQLKKMKHILNFEGLDTYAEVFLNDSLLLSANNAFRNWEVDISDALQAENELRVQFTSPDSIEKAEAAKLAYELPESPRVFTRKPQFQYGWDWGPTIKTMGIWRDISLLSYDQARLKEVYIETHSLDAKLAELTAHLTIHAQEEQEITVFLRNINTTENLEQKIVLKPTQTEYTFPFKIDIPTLWSTHDQGIPYRYDVRIELRDGPRVIDKLTKQFGLRTIELVNEKDSIGESFYFKLNGEPIYMKGANYIPQNIFLPEVTQEDREKLLNDVVAANMNMIRVWGGGVYEDDAFYELCDEKGILVWQDFMFACAMYPGDTNFIENVKQEAIQNVKRLRDHPSIALWCGNNENSEGWARWGWADDKTTEQRAEIWSDYHAIFNHVLPRVVDSLHPTVAYWESSPKYGRGDKRFKTEGDAHDWWVWHDGYPFEHFETAVPRFMSEFGFQSFPNYDAIRYFIEQDSIDLAHPAFAYHQKHARGFSLIREYMERDFPVPSQAEDYVYVSQLVQAYGITKGIRAHRRAKPYNMGSLYWQLNDCWPAVSWSSLDGHGQWKALHYKAKRAFENQLIIPFEENNTLKITVVDDNRTTMTADMYVLFRDFKGRILHKTETKVVRTFTDRNEVVFEVDLTKIEMDRSGAYAEIIFGNRTEIYFFVKPKELLLEPAAIQRETILTNTGFTVTLTSETLQKDVFLIGSEVGHWSDNFFDLLPGVPKTVQFKGNSRASNSFEIKTLNQLIDHSL